MNSSRGDCQPFHSSGVLPLDVPYDVQQLTIEHFTTMHIRPKSMHIDARNPSVAQIATYEPTVSYTPEYMHQLRTFLQPKEVLEATGYIVQELSETAIERKKKCQQCRKTILKGRDISKGKAEDNPHLPSKHSVLDVPPRLPEEPRDEGVTCRPLPLLQVSTTGSQAPVVNDSIQSSQIISAPKVIIRCRFHDGAVRYKMWSCCRKHVSSDPCKEAEFHTSRKYQNGQLENAWKFHVTPSANASSNVRAAVAIDCEMGTAASGDSELIRVTVIDYFSSETLVDSLVYPEVAMQHYNTRFSGITTRQMNLAHNQGRCLMGKQRAREAVWRFVGPDTLIVGHSAHNDLTAMRWIHHHVVDTWLIESIKLKDETTKAKQEEKESTVSLPTIDNSGSSQQEKPKKRPKGSGPLSLKTLTLLRWGRQIQMGNKGHDSLEDAIASRDLAHWNVLNKFGKF